MSVIIPFGYLNLMMLCMHLCCDDEAFYCFAVGFASIYCHGSNRYLIDDYSMVTHDLNDPIAVAPCILAAIDVSDAAFPSISC